MAQTRANHTDRSVEKFLDNIKDKQQRRDSVAIIKLMKSITKEEPRMWGSSVVGFGNVHLKYPSGRELDWFVAGFSPRKGNLTLYLSHGSEWPKDLMERLGKHKTGKGCVYIKKLDDVRVDVLKQLIGRSVKRMNAK